jgi:uncharacterized protein YkwD
MPWSFVLTFALLFGQADHSASQSRVKAAVQQAQPTPKLVSAAFPTVTPPAKPAHIEDPIAVRRLLELANQNRRRAGAPSLRLDEGLSEAARRHALLMIENSRLEHQFAGEPPLLQRIAQVSALRMDRAGENVAEHTSADRAHRALMLSPPHRQNLLDPGFDVAGIAAVWNDGRLYVVQDFGRELANYSPEQTAQLVTESIEETRQRAGLPDLLSAPAPDLDNAVCEMAQQGRVDATALHGIESNLGVATYTQGNPEILPTGVVRLLSRTGARQFSLGTCYARSRQYPVGMYWVAIVLY